MPECNKCFGCGLLQIKVELCKSCNGKKCIKCYKQSGYTNNYLSECNKCFGTGYFPPPYPNKPGKL